MWRYENFGVWQVFGHGLKQDSCKNMALLEPKTLGYYSFGHVYFLFAAWQKTMDMHLEDGWHTII